MVFFLFAVEAQHMGSVACLDKAVIVGGYVFLLIMTIEMDVRGVRGGH